MLPLIEELKRRSVLRVSTWYVVAGWLLLQVTDIIVGLTGLPEWTLRGVLYFLVAAFPLVLVLFWARGWFSPGPIDDRLSRFLETTIGRLAPAICPPSWEIASPPGDPRAASVAVLPFRNLSGAADEFVADGLTEEVLATLAKSEILRVPSRTSCFHFKASSAELQTIAATLQVDHLMEGSVRRSNGHYRVSVELVDAASDTQIWSETYDQTEIHNLHESIARAAARSLGIEWKAPVANGTKASLAPSAETYTAYLKGRFALNRATAEGCREAVEHFEYALATDPCYARAHAGIAQAYVWLASYGSLHPEVGFPKARQSAEQALALDDRLAEAHLAIGQIRLGFDWDFTGAETSYQRAMELDPANVDVLHRFGHFLEMMGRWANAIAIRRRAVEIDPLSSPVRSGLADTYFTSGAIDEALAEIARLRELDSEYPIYHLLARIELARSNPRRALEMIEQDDMTWRKLYISSIALYRLHEQERAAACLRQLIEQHGADAALQIAIVYTQMGDFDRAFSWLERASAQRDPGMIELKADPELAPLRQDARFEALLQQIGFPD